MKDFALVFGPILQHLASEKTKERHDALACLGESITEHIQHLVSDECCRIVQETVACLRLDAKAVRRQHGSSNLQSSRLLNTVCKARSLLTAIDSRFPQVHILQIVADVSICLVQLLESEGIGSAAAAELLYLLNTFILFRPQYLSCFVETLWARIACFLARANPLLEARFENEIFRCAALLSLMIPRENAVFYAKKLLALSARYLIEHGNSNGPTLYNSICVCVASYRILKLHEESSDLTGEIFDAVVEAFEADNPTIREAFSTLVLENLDLLSDHQKERLSSAFHRASLKSRFTQKGTTPFEVVKALQASTKSKELDAEIAFWKVKVEMAGLSFVQVERVGCFSDLILAAFVALSMDKLEDGKKVIAFYVAFLEHCSATQLDWILSLVYFATRCQKIAEAEIREYMPTIIKLLRKGSMVTVVMQQIGQLILDFSPSVNFIKYDELWSIDYQSVLKKTVATTFYRYFVVKYSAYLWTAEAKNCYSRFLDRVVKELLHAAEQKSVPADKRPTERAVERFLNTLHIVISFAFAPFLDRVLLDNHCFPVIPTRSDDFYGQKAAEFYSNLRRIFPEIPRAESVIEARFKINNAATSVLWAFELLVSDSIVEVPLYPTTDYLLSFKEIINVLSGHSSFKRIDLPKIITFLVQSLENLESTTLSTNAELCFPPSSNLARRNIVQLLDGAQECHINLKHVIIELLLWFCQEKAIFADSNHDAELAILISDLRVYLLSLLPNFRSRPEFLLIFVEYRHAFLQENFDALLEFCENYLCDPLHEKDEFAWNLVVEILQHVAASGCTENPRWQALVSLCLDKYRTWKLRWSIMNGILRLFLYSSNLDLSSSSLLLFPHPYFYKHVDNHLQRRLILEKKVEISKVCSNNSPNPACTIIALGLVCSVHDQTGSYVSSVATVISDYFDCIEKMNGPSIFKALSYYGGTNAVASIMNHVTRLFIAAGKSAKDIRPLLALIFGDGQSELVETILLENILLTSGHPIHLLHKVFSKIVAKALMLNFDGSHSDADLLLNKSLKNALGSTEFEQLLKRNVLDVVVHCLCMTFSSGSNNHVALHGSFELCNSWLASPNFGYPTLQKCLTHLVTLFKFGSLEEFMSPGVVLLLSMRMFDLYERDPIGGPRYLYAMSFLWSISPKPFSASFVWNCLVRKITKTLLSSHHCVQNRKFIFDFFYTISLYGVEPERYCEWLLRIILLNPSPDPLIGLLEQRVLEYDPGFYLFASCLANSGNTPEINKTILDATDFLNYQILIDILEEIDDVQFLLVMQAILELTKKGLNFRGLDTFRNRSDQFCRGSLFKRNKTTIIAFRSLIESYSSNIQPSPELSVQVQNDFEFLLRLILRQFQTNDNALFSLLQIALILINSDSCQEHYKWESLSPDLQNIFGFMRNDDGRMLPTFDSRTGDISVSLDSLLSSDNPCLRDWCLVLIRDHVKNPLYQRSCNLCNILNQESLVELLPRLVFHAIQCQPAIVEPIRRFIDSSLSLDSLMSSNQERVKIVLSIVNYLQLQKYPNGKSVLDNQKWLQADYKRIAIWSHQLFPKTALMLWEIGVQKYDAIKEDEWILAKTDNAVISRSEGLAGFLKILDAMSEEKTAKMQTLRIAESLWKNQEWDIENLEEYWCDRTNVNLFGIVRSIQRTESVASCLFEKYVAELTADEIISTAPIGMIASLCAYPEKRIGPIDEFQLVLLSINCRANLHARPSFKKDLSEFLETRGNYSIVPGLKQAAKIASQLGDQDVDYLVTDKVARHLWSIGKQEEAVELAKRSVDITADLFIKERLALGHARAGKWLATLKAERPSVIISSYLDKAVALGGTECSLKTMAKIFHTIARLVDQQYEQVNSSENINGRERLLKKTKADLDVMRQLTGAKRDNEAYVRALSSLELQYRMDQAEYEQLVKDRNSFLFKAIESYLKSLEYSDKYDMSVFRLCSLWLGNRCGVGVNELVERYIGGRVKSFKFLPLIYQLAARAETPSSISDNGGVFQRVLERLLFSMASQHPFHCVYQILSLRAGGAVASSGSKRKLVSAPDENGPDRRAKAASNLIDKLKAANARLGRRVASIENVCQAYSELAGAEISADFKPNVLMPFDSKWMIQKIKTLELVPVPTRRLAVDPTGQYLQVVSIRGFGGGFRVIGGINLPKVVECLGSDGHSYRQLVKGKDDVRQDAVMEQVFSMVDNLLQRNESTRKRGLGIRTFRVIPLHPLAGLLEWVSDTMPIGDYLLPAHERINGQDIGVREARQIMKREFERPGTTAASKHRVYLTEVCARFQPVFRHFFWETSCSAQDWWDRRQRFVSSVSASSMIGYIVGLGDRHCQNILLDKTSGQVIHIDLNMIFEVGKTLRIPERVPFRLTRDICDGMGPSASQPVSPSFLACSKEVLVLLRKQHETVLMIMEVFKYDPLYRWTMKPLKVARKMAAPIETIPFESVIGVNRHDDDDESKEADRALLRVKEKLVGREDGTGLSESGQVHYLVQTATNSELLCQMYPGWQPWV